MKHTLSCTAVICMHSPFLKRAVLLSKLLQQRNGLSRAEERKSVKQPTEKKGKRGPKMASLSLSLSRSLFCEVKAAPTPEALEAWSRLWQRKNRARARKSELRLALSF